MLNETEINMVAAFFPEGVERTTKEMEKRSLYSHERVHSILNALCKKGVLKKRSAGKTSLYSIARFDDLVYLAFANYSVDRKTRFAKKYPRIASAIEELIMKAKPDATIIFGSYSKGEAQEDSDVDVLCLGEGGDADSIALSLRHRYNLRINPVNVKKENFRNIKKENQELWDDLIQFGIIFKGLELFYELVYR
jgi:predicted nucleotidyltransferase